jgi:hypothetical protein
MLTSSSVAILSTQTTLEIGGDVKRTRNTQSFNLGGVCATFSRIESRFDRQTFFNSSLTMKVASTNDVKVYTVAGEGVRSLPEWLTRQKKRSLRDDPGIPQTWPALTEDFQSRIELIQDFDFPEASNRIKISRDGNFAVATGKIN